jgi:light-regulated signal transduction histidine kinase (bacteriophytochrome)
VEPIDPEVLGATINAFLRARRAEEALRRSTEELRWFSYRVAHDLNEPLRTITVYAQLLQRAQGAGPQAETSHYIDFIGTAAVRMQSFIDGLLDYSRAASLPLEMGTINCDALLDRAIANLDGAIRESGAQVIREPLPVIEGDPRIEYVLQNLLSNAIKYRRLDVPLKIHISARQDGDAWVVSVHDNGIGIAPEHQETIFEVFRRLHGHEIPGSGIGLALCRKIIQAQGGAIWVSSEVTEGTTFYFTVPAHPAMAPHPEGKAHPA